MSRGERPRYGEGRSALVNAAVRLVAREGVEGLTYRAVARDAGVSPGAVQHHFATLNELAEAGLDHCVDISLSLTELGARDGDFYRFLDHLPAAISATMDEQAYQYEMTLASQRRPELRPHVERYYQRYLEAVATSLRSLDLPADEATATLVFCAIDGLVFQAVVLGRTGGSLDAPLEQLRRTLQQLSSQQRL